MANPSYTYTLTNGTTADADQVMQNFNDILNGVTDGTKDISVAALTAAGTATLNGNVTLGNATADDITTNGSLASSIPVKTDATYDIGTSSLGLRRIYFGGNSNRVGIGASGSTSATYNLTLPTTAGTSGYALKTNGSGVLSWETPTPITTRGDIIRGGVSGVVERYAALTDNRVLRGDGTDVLLGQIDDPDFFTSGAAAGVSTIGILTAAAQTIGGSKTFNDVAVFTGGLNSTNGSASITTTPVTVVSLTGYTPGVYLFTISIAGATSAYGAALVVKSTAITYALSTILVSGGTIGLSGSDVQFNRSSGGSATHRWTMTLFNTL